MIQESTHSKNLSHLGALHDGVVTHLSDFVLREVDDQLHGLRLMDYLVESESRVPECLDEVLVKPADLRTDIVIVTGRFRFTSWRTHTSQITACQ